ncbi:Hypothetical_protein [Hexamita inflata]|uniref:Hypothetical_protein n=1 Tax=Hexamita inflata TaxID=28002 RepID=A0AA86UNP0_9EUKA|nr:Hypothetical protein HINF_LOCUS33483 [Hexamita inflata]
MKPAHACLVCPGTEDRAKLQPRSDMISQREVDLTGFRVESGFVAEEVFRNASPGTEAFQIASAPRTPTKAVTGRWHSGSKSAKQKYTFCSTPCLLTNKLEQRRFRQRRGCHVDT